jgi:hypothetical protein
MRPPAAVRTFCRCSSSSRFALTSSGTFHRHSKPSCRPCPSTSWRTACHLCPGSRSHLFRMLHPCHSTSLWSRLCRDCSRHRFWRYRQLEEVQVELHFEPSGRERLRMCLEIRELWISYFPQNSGDANAIRSRGDSGAIACLPRSRKRNLPERVLDSEVGLLVEDRLGEGK